MRTERVDYSSSPFLQNILKLFFFLKRQSPYKKDEFVDPPAGVTLTGYELFALYRLIDPAVPQLQLQNSVHTTFVRLRKRNFSTSFNRFETLNSVVQNGKLCDSRNLNPE